MFDQQDFNNIKDYFKTIDPKIYQIMNKHGYIPPKPRRDLFAILIGVIIGQKIRFKKAQALRGKLYTALGTDNFQVSDVITLGKTGLIALGVEDYIADLIIYISTEVSLGKINLTNTDHVRKLINIKGIGPWTINCTNLMHSLNEDSQYFDDIVLYEDLIIRRGLKKMYGVQTKKDMEIVSKNWSPFKGIVTWYLWNEFTF